MGYLSGLAQVLGSEDAGDLSFEEAEEILEEIGHDGSGNRVLTAADDFESPVLERKDEKYVLRKPLEGSDYAEVVLVPRDVAEEYI